jgi:aspartate/methionine/tyrosine aminotransferase
LEFAKHLVADVGVATVPGSSFYRDPMDGSHQVRFAFCKKDKTLLEAGKRLKNIQASRAAAD